MRGHLLGGDDLARNDAEDRAHAFPVHEKVAAEPGQGCDLIRNSESLSAVTGPSASTSRGAASRKVLPRFSFLFLHGSGHERIKLTRAKSIVYANDRLTRSVHLLDMCEFQT